MPMRRQHPGGDKMTEVKLWLENIGGRRTGHLLTRRLLLPEVLRYQSIVTINAASFFPPRRRHMPGAAKEQNSCLMAGLSLRPPPHGPAGICSGPDTDVKSRYLIEKRDITRIPAGRQRYLRPAHRLERSIYPRT